MKPLFLRWGLILAFVQCPIHAEFCSFSYDWTGGYRHDQTKTTSDLFIHAFHPLKKELFSTTIINEENLSIFETGLMARGMLNSAYIKGFYNHGWVINGKYAEVVDSKSGEIDRTHALIHSGQTNDLSLGLGYQFCFIDIVKLGFSFGWSYDDLRAHLSHAKTNGKSDKIFDGLAYKQHWQGPWLGGEVALCLFCIDINAGYEFHWTAWQADKVLPGPDIFNRAFSDNRKATGIGNVAFLQANYHFFPFLHVGLGFKYQDRTVRNGEIFPKVKDFFKVIPFKKVINTIPKATWNSYEIQLNAGIHF